MEKSWRLVETNKDGFFFLSGVLYRDDYADGERIQLILPLVRRCSYSEYSQQAIENKFKIVKKDAIDGIISQEKHRQD